LPLKLPPPLRPDTAELERWIERSARLCAEKLANCISATGLVKRRPGFGQTIRPAAGSVLASPEADGEPDYFFHWLRDSAVVMDAVRVLIASGDSSDDWEGRFEEFVRFSLALGELRGAALPLADFHRHVSPAFAQYVRPDAECAAVAGDAVADDVRFNPDGTLDRIKWARPQHDGAPTRALVCLRWAALARSPEFRAPSALSELILGDLDYTCRRAGARCYDIWEEELGRHYYTLLVEWAALQQGAIWVERRGDRQRAQRFGTTAAALAPLLDEFWSEQQRIYRSRVMTEASGAAKDLDMSVILAVLHAGLASGPHSIADLRVLATLRRLEALFASEYAINRDADPPFAFGRYKGDVYVSGGAWYVTSFAAAEFYYRLACAARQGAVVNGDTPAQLIARADAILAQVRRHVPDSGELSEQFDRTTGEQTSARNLAWSYAAFVAAWEARRQALCAAV
jgi:glucoamylase